MHADATPFDLTDVPSADPAHLARLMSILIREGHGLVLLEGVDASALNAAETEFWSAGDIGRRAKVVAIVRFRALIQTFAVESFATTHLQHLFLDCGLALLPRLFRVAATMRLNARRGFNSSRMLWSVAARQSRTAESVSRRRESQIVAPPWSSAHRPATDAGLSVAVFCSLSRAEQRADHVSHIV